MLLAKKILSILNFVLISNKSDKKLQQTFFQT